MTGSHLTAVRGASVLVCDKDGSKPSGGRPALDRAELEARPA
ncbi:hypothetical protein [Streptomyces hirsutus]|nr:hypothetical protein [Streptomyces hirsutus]